MFVLTRLFICNCFSLKITDIIISIVLHKQGPVLHTGPPPGGDCCPIVCLCSVHSDIKFLERFEGDSVLLPCVLQRRDPPPFGVYLKRSWLRPSDVLFMYQMSEFSVNNDGDRDRTSVTGDPSDHAVNVTISQLRVRDTDQYECEFVAENPLSEDIGLPGDTKFFLLVRAGQFSSVPSHGVKHLHGWGHSIYHHLPPRLRPTENFSPFKKRM